MADYIFPENLTTSNAKDRYAMLLPRRNAVETRAKTYAKYTIPAIAPEITDGENQTEVTFDLNAIGPRAVQFLANKYAETLFPANSSTFKMELPKHILDALVAGGADANEIALKIATFEDDAKKYQGSIGSRVAFIEIIEHLLITGNCLQYYPKEGNIQVYPLRDYVIRREVGGRVAEIVVRDSKALLDLPHEYQLSIIGTLGIRPEDVNTYECELYTHIQWDGNIKKYHISQAVENLQVGQPYIVKEKLLRWKALSFKRYNKETYGRGLVEDYINVFYVLSLLQECLIIGAAIATDIKYLAKPGSQIDIPTITQAPSGSYHMGNEGDVATIGLNGRLSDLQFVEAIINRLERLIGTVFLMNSAVTRDSERTTATEFRAQVAELETAHSGSYSLLAQEWLLPNAYLTLDSVGMDLESTDFEPTIMTGVDAMSRSTTNDSIMRLFQQIATLKDVPEAFQKVIDPLKLLVTLASGNDIDVTKITPTKAEQQKQQQSEQAAEEQAAQNEMVTKGVGQQIGNASPEVAAAMVQNL